MADPIGVDELVLVTGAAGRIASALRPELRRHWRLRLLDRDAPRDGLDPREEAVQVDIRDPDATARAAEGCAAVIHLAGIATEAPPADLLEVNAGGTYNVVHAAALAGCRRFVFASSNHVTGYYPTTTRVTPTMPYRPDGLYGASKVYGEAVCRLHHDRDGLEVAVLRIGSSAAQPSLPRHAYTWLSHRDLAELVRRCLIAPSYDWIVVYGSSANHRSYWDDAEARRRLGFVPVDDAGPLVPSGPIDTYQSTTAGRPDLPATTEFARRSGERSS